MMMTHEAALAQAKQLVQKMTIDERIQQISVMAPELKALEIPNYNYWNEALHGVARAGVATMFPQAIGMAAMFDPEMMQAIGDIIATEGRAKYNLFQAKNDRDFYKGLTFWSPNINIFRDPRWGRGHETYGEDPYLTSQLGSAFIQGLQGTGDYLKVAACAKHFAVHSGPEAIRHSFNAEVSDKDLYETYLPAFETAVKEADVESVMSAYNAINGVPAPVNQRLFDILRNDWHFKGHVTSDVGGIEDVFANHKYVEDAGAAIGLAVTRGNDLCAGLITDKLHDALAHEQVTEAAITQSVERLLATRIRLGLFADDCEYDQIPFEAIDSDQHRESAYQATVKSLVLLKNEADYLPLDAKQLQKVAVIGPNANSRRALEGNYQGTASRYTTILEGIQDELAGIARVNYAQGCHLIKDQVEPLAGKDDRLAEAISTAEHSDLVVLCLGMDASIEGEAEDPGNPYGAGDKTGLSLPGRQQHLLDELLKLNKPVVLIICAGSAITFDGQEENPNLKAILEAWYPGAQGGKAIARMLLGQEQPSGKLPITFYQNLTDFPEFTDYQMAGRTYRYLKKAALYPFGYGLSYADITVEQPEMVIENDRYYMKAIVKNNSQIATEEVIQVYSRALESENEIPNHKLCAFKRVRLAANVVQMIQIEIPQYAFEVVNQQGERLIEGRQFEFSIGTAQPDQRSAELTGKEVATYLWSKTN